MQNMTITELYWGEALETLFLAINVFTVTISEVVTQGNKAGSVTSKASMSFCWCK